MLRKVFFLVFSLLSSISSFSQETLRQYLSGTGCDDMVEWDFKCSEGRGSGKWTKIGVPSCWELQGFGTYQYGMRFYGIAKPEGIASEKGQYKTEFALPQEWEGRQIELVFEAVFTDARVIINSRKAGQGLYQGGFTRHTIDISDRVFFGAKKNRLEVEVSKESGNPQVNLAERRADYWNFGGIWRPVFIVSKPWQNIRRVAVNATMDGRFRADVFLSRALAGCSVGVGIVDAKGTEVAKSGQTEVAGDHAYIDFSVKSPKLWNAEQPNLYTAVFTLKDAGGKTLHVERQRFGFRTIEYRHSYNGDDGDGVFINGRKVIMKGVNRHSFWPESGRTLSKAKNIDDVKLIKSMNMNAVRLSHYPADPEFLDACDSLGLYVECELPGWHWAHETIIGTQIAEEMVMRDVNHPSIIFWSNGNEGGFNYELESVFTNLDPQQRVVLYPWANRNGFETKHYRSWGETAMYMRQREIFMPTEFLHGLYDGGHGAGLKDYWELMMQNPRCAGGFLWDLKDQAVARTDLPRLTETGQVSAKGDHFFLDPVGNFGADGIVGPHGEREGSYYTIKEIWSPVRIKRREERGERRERTEKRREERGERRENTLEEEKVVVENCYNFTNLKDCRFSYKWLVMPGYGESKVTVSSEGALPSPDVEPGQSATIAIPKGTGDIIQLTATDPHGEEIFTWSYRSDAYKPGKTYKSQPFTTTETDKALTVVCGPASYTFSKKDGRLMGVKTATHVYSLSGGPRFVAVKRADRSEDGFYNHDDKGAFEKKTMYKPYLDHGKFAGFTTTDSSLTVRYAHGSMQEVEWLFSADGIARITATCDFSGVVDLMGICFDYPEQQVTGKQWVGCGPYRVWQNRMEGPQYGYWQNDYNDPVPAETWLYPEFKGYFADVDWMLLQTREGNIGLSDFRLQTSERSDFRPQTSEPYVGVFTPRDGRDHQLYDLPQTGLSVLSVIPAVRNKVNTTDLNGPSAQPHFVSGKHIFGATLHFE